MKKGLDKDPDFVAQLDIARHTALVRAYQIDYVKTTLSAMKNCIKNMKR